jgi:hypothetical protein
VLQHLPAATLTALTVQLDWSAAPHVAALCSLTGLRQLELTSARGYTSWQASDVLAPLSALQQLTCLHLDFLRRQQLQHLRLPQLQALDVRLEQCMQGEQAQMQLSQITGLTMLCLTDWAALLQPDDVFPPHLRELEFTVVGDRRCSLQPLLLLTQLRMLHVSIRGVPEGCEDCIGQLSSLTSLQDLRLSYGWRIKVHIHSAEEDRSHAAFQAINEAVAAASVWQQLPLKSLSWTSQVLPAAVLQQVAVLTGLTHLMLSMHQSSTRSGLEASPRQLAGILQQLQMRRELTIATYGTLPFDDVDAVGVGSAAGAAAAAAAAGPFHTVDGVVAFLQAVGGLSMLEEASVVLL